MAFQKGNRFGGNKPGVSHKAKEKVLSKWLEIFNKQGVSILEDLAKDHKYEFMRIGVSLMPKEQKIDMQTNMFDSWSNEDLAKFVETGKRPEQ